MRRTLLTIFIVILGIPLFAQDIHFPAAIVAAGGNSEGSSTTLSRWRLAPIYVLTIYQDNQWNKIPEQMGSEADWMVKLYPNPTEDFANLEFKLPEEREFIIRISDASGRLTYMQDARKYIDGSNVELDLSRYQPGLYLLEIISTHLSEHKTYRIQKL